MKKAKGRQNCAVKWEPKFENCKSCLELDRLVNKIS